MATTHRSPNYPAVSLPVAKELAQRLYDKEKQSPAAPDQAVRAWGYAGLSGPSRTKLSALRKYGLVEETGRGVRVTPRAMAILFPNDPAEEAQALRDAALEPELFRDLATYEGASDDNLVSRLVRMGFTPAGARAAVASYRETVGLVPNEASAYDARHEKEAEPSERHRPVGQTVTHQPVAPVHESDLVFTFMLGGARVDLSVRGGPLAKQGISLLRDYLDLAEKSISAREAEDVPDASPIALGPETTEPELLS